jgi:hypothetical protein
MDLLYESRNLQGNAIFATELHRETKVLTGQCKAEVLAVIALKDA